MFEAFLYEFKKEDSFFKSLKNIRKTEWVFLLGVLLSCVLGVFSVATTNMFLFLIAILLMAFFEVCEMVYSNRILKNSMTPDAKTGGQIKWFRKHQVEKVDVLLDEKLTGLPKARCIDFLISECDRMLAKTRPSEIAKKRIRPILYAAGIIVSVIVNVYMLQGELSNAKADDVVSLTVALKNLLGSLTESMAKSQEVFLFFISFSIIFMAYLIFVMFLLVPLITKIIDKDWATTEKLKAILLYIKAEQPPLTDRIIL